MTVGELIAELEQYDEDATVRFAEQPSWPFKYSIRHETAVSEDGSTVYLVEGEQLEYLPGEIRDQLGW